MNKALFVCILLLPLLNGCNAKAQHQSNNTSAVTKPSEKSDNDCVNNFAVLKKVDPEQYSIYQKQFYEVNKSYEFFIQNSAIMDKDPKELITIESNSKLHLICSRVKNAAYASIEKQMHYISQL